MRILRYEVYIIHFKISRRLLCVTSHYVPQKVIEDLGHSAAETSKLGAYNFDIHLIAYCADEGAKCSSLDEQTNGQLFFVISTV